MLKKILAAGALTALAISAQAAVTGGVAANQDPSAFITLSSANVIGGALYTTDQLPNAAIPFNATPLKSTVGTWLAAGPSNTNNGGGSATVSFAGGTSFVSFLWGSPDMYNALSVTTTAGTTTSFTSASFPGVVFAGNQEYASYLGLNGNGDLITSVTFSSPITNAFEASNFSVTTPVPEPETYALMLAGLGMLGFIARRRKSA